MVRKCNSCKGEHWSQKYWRPAMAWQYFVICLFDFMFAPMLSAVFFAVKNLPHVPWHPLTLEGGGLYHLAMGAILGVAAWTRGQEKITFNNISSSDNEQLNESR